MRRRLCILDTLVWNEGYLLSTISAFDLGAWYANSERIGIKLAL